MALRYNRQIVDNEMEQFRLNNPNASNEVIENKRNELICRESIYAIAIDYYTRFDANAGTPAQIEESVRSGEDETEMRIRGYFNNLTSPVRERYLEAFQEKAFAATDKKTIDVFSHNVSISLSSKYLRDFKWMTEQGDEYVKGLFAPVTDPSKMIFDDVSENELITIQLLRDKQAESDAIRIAVPEGKTEAFVSYVVMGEFFKEKQLNKTTDYLFSRGSTIPKNFSPAENATATFFENTIISEPRANMHAVRLIVPEVRHEAKEIVESGNTEGMTENLKIAFNALYERASSAIGIAKPLFFFSVRQANQLLDEAKRGGINLESIGATEDKIKNLRAMKKLVDFQAETQRMIDTMKSKTEDFYFSGYNRDKDMTPEDRQTVVTVAARMDVIKKISTELTSLHDMYEMVGVTQADAKMSGRSLTPSEIRLLEDEDGLVAESREYVETGVLNTEINRHMATPEGRIHLMAGGLSVDSRFEGRVPMSAYIKEVQSEFLDNIEAFVTGKEEASGVLRAVKEIKQKAQTVPADGTWQQYNELLVPYEKLITACETYAGKIPPAELSSNPNAFRFVTTTDGIKNIVKAINDDPRFIADQKAFEKRRSELHASVQNEALKYDKEKVQQRLQQFREANPNPTPEQLKTAETDIICDEALIYAQLSAFERCVPNGKDLRNFSKAEKDLRDNTGVISVDRKLIEKFSGEDKLRFMQKYQNTLAKMQTENDYKVFRESTMHLKNYNPDARRHLVDNLGEGVFKALFAPKTDRSGILMSHIDESGIVKNADVLRWQNEADAIEIPKPANMNESLVSFLVLGRATQNDLLLEASYYTFGRGSTLPQGYRRESNVLVSLWDNLIRADERGNMHCIRSVVPKARTDVKAMIESGNTAELNKYLKNSFDVMYNQIVGIADHDNHAWIVPMKKLGELMDGLQKSGISPQSIGIDAEKLSKYNEMKDSLDIVRQKCAVEADVQKKMFTYFESGFDPKLSPQGDEQTRILIEKQAVLWHTNLNFYAKINHLRDEMKWSDLNSIDDMLLEREVDTDEKMFRQDPEAYMELMRRQTRDSFNRQFNSAVNRPDMNVIMGGSGIRVESDKVLDTAHCEQNFVGQELAELKNRLSKPQFDEIRNVGIVRSQLDSLIEQHNSLADFSPDSLNTLVAPYTQLSEDIAKFVERIPEELENSPDTAFIEGAGFDLGLFAKRISKEPERIRKVEETAREFDSIRRGMRPAFCERFSSYRETLEQLGAGSGNTSDFNRMRTAMESLNRKLNSMYGENGEDRNTILSRSDAQEIKNLYDSALKNCTDYINNSGKSSLDDGRVFMATELQSLLARDMKFFSKLPECKEITLSSALTARYGEPLDVETASARMSNLAKKLNEVGTRFGGNSEEFEKMKSALGAFSNRKVDKAELLNLTKKLATATEKYIGAKQTVPSTEKGKLRLQIAREARELCSDITNTSGWEYFGDRQKDDTSYKDRLKSYITNKQSGALAEMKQAVAAHDKSAFIQKFSELIYLNASQKKLTNDGEGAAEYLSSNTMNAGIAKLNPITAELLKNTPSKELGKALFSDNAPERLQQIFNVQMRESVQKNNQKAMDLSDGILSSKRPQLDM